MFVGRIVKVAVPAVVFVSSRSLLWHTVRKLASLTF